MRVLLDDQKTNRTRVEIISAKVRSGNTRKASALLRVASVDAAHSNKIDRAEAQRKARRAKR